MMNKQLITLIIALLTTTYAAFAQKTTESPYSFYGIGERNFGGIAEESAMGGLGIYADSTRVNIQNPAALSQLKFTAFSAGFTMQRKNIVTNNTKLNTQFYTRLSYSRKIRSIIWVSTLLFRRLQN